MISTEKINNTLMMIRLKKKKKPTKMTERKNYRFVITAYGQHEQRTATQTNY